MSTLKYPLVTIIMQKAVIITGGKQFLVSVGDTIKSEKIDTKEKNLKLTEVLAVSDGQKYTFGTPFIKDASVEVEVVKQFKEDKVQVLKFRSKSRYRRRNGHRQPKTLLKVTKIS